jgi:cellulose synthase/poly-beta-1,6-N-acetylglucosamine synthase-like glycosyltransferase
MWVCGCSFRDTDAPQLGEVLLHLGLVRPEDIEEALAIQKERGGRLGWILMSLGKIRRLDLFRALGKHYCIPFHAEGVDALLRHADPKLVRAFPLGEVLSRHILPWRREEGRLILLTDYPCATDQAEFCAAAFPDVSEFSLHLVTDLDFLRLIQRLFGQELLDESILGLFFRAPEESANPVFTRAQIAAIGVLGFAALGLFYARPVLAVQIFFAAVQILFLTSVLFKLMVSLVGAGQEQAQPVTDEEVRRLRDDELPVYTILVPVYREPQVVGQLISALKAMDYPQHKLDVLLLLEEDDAETLTAAKAAAPPGNWRFIILPNAQPKTKPKACNYGVFFSRGEFLTIYDAEDRPEPDQLKKAVIAFRKHPENFVCFQAALNYFNARENLITKLFTLEYSYWFDYLLPGLDRLRLPIPLGGTSNHFRTRILKELGAWDPFNVTEDADLGIRACANGFQVGIINSTTFEEANSRYGNWIRQRSRWIKGYMQTALVYNRHPIRMLRRIGLKNWLGFQLFVAGTPLLFLCNPIVWSVFLLWLCTGTKALDPFFPPLLVYIGLFNLIIGNFLGIYLNMIAVYRRKLYSLLPVALINPLYWLFFHSIAAYKALWQLVSKPFYWEKTDHGLTSVNAPH